MLKDIKFYFENLFLTKWTDTHIHFGGQEFDPSDVQAEAWVNPYYSPLKVKNFGMGVGSRKYTGHLFVVCWHKNDVDVMELGDKIEEFMVDNVDKSLFQINGFDVIDHGWDNSGKSFMMLSFFIESVRGACFAKADEKLIVNGGILIVNNGVQITN